MVAIKRRRGFLEKTIEGLSETLDRAGASALTSERAGLLQTLDPRVKLCGAACLIFGAVGTGSLKVTVAVFFITCLLLFLSHISFHPFLTRTWLAILWFTGMIALPAIFLTPGNTIAHLPLFHWSITSQGVESAVRLIMRAEAASTATLLVVLTTPWTHLLKALRIFHVPVIFITILGMTHRYIYLLLHLARDRFEALSSRQVGPLGASQQREMAASSVIALLNRSLQLGEEVFLAMQSRGFSGEIHLLDDFCFGNRDRVAMVFIVCLALSLFLGSC